MKKISVVVPMYYEEEVANECYTRLKNVLEKIENYNYEIIFVNDGSKDKTLEILKEIAKENKNVKIISFSRNFGHQCAVTAGLRYVTATLCNRRCNSNNRCRLTRPTRINTRNDKIVGRRK